MVHYRPKSPTSAYKTYLYLQVKIGHKANQTWATKPTASPLLAVQGLASGEEEATMGGCREDSDNRREEAVAMAGEGCGCGKEERKITAMAAVGGKAARSKGDWRRGQRLWPTVGSSDRPWGGGVGGGRQQRRRWVREEEDSNQWLRMAGAGDCCDKGDYGRGKKRQRGSARVATAGE
ncbi:hypothetical protein BHM03_00055279 [Ensete ventricosum]|nr:hypothetical protein BHM03_00055279 [Ensete ventricosum]